MDWILLAKAAVQGLVEGATEFIPVSSTGHLILSGDWLGFDEYRGAETFDVFIQLGAILAVVWLYRERILRVLRSASTDPTSRRLILNLLIAFLPSALVGFVARDFIKEQLFRPSVVAIALVVGGVLILILEAWKRPVHTETVEEIRPQTALAIGFAQVLSLVPGTSRSGATIMGGLGVGLSRLAATEFSFFLAIPTMFAATLFDLFKSLDHLQASDTPVFAVGFVVSFLSALVVIRALLRFVANNTFRPFAWYRIVFGLILLYVYRDSFGAL